jgi:hypothetical protein
LQIAHKNCSSNLEIPLQEQYLSKGLGSFIGEDLIFSRFEILDFFPAGD